MKLFKVKRIPPKGTDDADYDRKGNAIWCSPISCIICAETAKHAERRARQFYAPDWRFAELEVKEFDLSTERIISTQYPAW